MLGINLVKKLGNSQENVSNHSTCCAFDGHLEAKGAVQVDQEKPKGTFQPLMRRLVEAPKLRFLD